MVCTGNICRSPMAEIVLREKLVAEGLSSFVEVDSTGISGEESGNTIDYRARQVLKAAGYSDNALENHRARRVPEEQLASRHLLLAMTTHHAQELIRRANAAGLDGSNIKMFRSFDSSIAKESPAWALDVSDPWYGGLSDFEECLEIVEQSVEGIIRQLKKEIQK